MATTVSEDVKARTPLLDLSTPGAAGTPADAPAPSYGTASSPEENTPRKPATLTELSKNARCLLEESSDNHVMEYDTRELGTWDTLLQYTGTIWATPLLLQAVIRLIALSLLIASFMVFQPDPESVVKANFMQLASALKVFVTFLLGFFMSSSISRWSDTVDGFLVLFNSSRNLNMQFHALGVDDTKRKRIARFGILSAIFLHKELSMRIIKKPEEAQQAESDLLEGLVEVGLLTQSERKTMGKVSDRSGLCWVWVASLLGRLAQDGDIPPMASPTYGRLITLAQVAQEGIRKVRVSVAVQSPFVYVHTLAFLVHVNNIFCAVAYGCVLGTGIASISDRLGIYKFHTRELEIGFEQAKPRGSVSGDVQTIITSTLTCIVFPILLQAFLQIGLLLAQPLDEVSKIPAERLIKQLQRDLEDQDIVANELSSWEKPRFKQK